MHSLNAFSLTDVVEHATQRRGAKAEVAYAHACFSYFVVNHSKIMTRLNCICTNWERRFFKRSINLQMVDYFANKSTMGKIIRVVKDSR